MKKIVALLLFVLYSIVFRSSIYAAPSVTITSPLDSTTYGTSVNFSTSGSSHSSIVSVLDSSLIAWWPLNNNGTGGLDLTDKSGSNNTLSNINATYFANGKLGSAAQLSGNSQYLRANNSINLTTKGAMSAWVYADGFRSSANPRILGTSTNTYGQILVQDSTHKLAFYTQSHDMIITNYVFPADGSWHFVMFNWGPTGGDLYVDNVSVWNLSTAVTLNSSSFTPEIGYGIATDYWTGKIDDVMYFNNTLTSDEITALFNGSAISHSTTLSETSHTYKAYVQDSTGSIVASSTNTFTVSSVVPSPSPSPSPTPTPVISTTSSTSSQNTSNNSVCESLPPSGIPHLYQVDSSPNSATLHFTPVSGADSYYILYGTDANVNQFGTSFSYSDTSGAVSYKINSLKPGISYYFSVRGGNGCASGNWSNIASTTTSLVSPILVSPIATPIASNTDQPEQIKKSKGTNLDIKVLSTTGQAIEGLIVTIHSKVQTQKTDKNGIASFTDVEPGEHDVVLSYNDYQGQQKITVNADSDQQKITVEVRLKQGVSLEIFIGIITLLLLLICILYINKRKDR